MNYKVIGIDQREYGPISADVARQWIAERRLNSMSLAQAEGTVEWKPLTTFLDFQAAPANMAPPPAPAPLPAAPYPVYPRTSSMAVMGLVMGILTVSLGSCCYGVPFNILGVVFSGVALSQINSNPQIERGKGMAIAGLVLSILGTLVPLLILALIGLFAGAAHHPHWYRL